MNILITSAGRRVSLLRFFKNELNALIRHAKIYACDMDPCLSSACNVADEFFTVPSVLDEGYSELLLTHCLEKQIGLIIPTLDTELLLLAQKRHIFEKHNINVVISEPHLVKIYRNKRLTADFFSAHAIPFIKEFDKNNFQLPVFIKPEDGSRSVNSFLVRKEEDLKSEFFSDDKLMFMEYIDHNEHDEFTIDLYYDKNNILKCVLPRKRLLVRDGEVNKAVTREEPFVKDLWEKLKYIEGARGVITLQIFKNRLTEKIYGIEINPRFSGGFPLSYLAGANFPKWIIKEYLFDEVIGEFHDWKKNLLMLRYDAEILVEDYE